MKLRHSGKWRNWFIEATWSIQHLDASTFGQLIFYETDWVKKASLIRDSAENNRLLSKVAENALRAKYLQNSNDLRHKYYYDAIKAGTLRLTDSERLVVCTPNEQEQRDNPGGSYYLLDGTGRGLAYAILLAEKEIEFGDVEAFVAENNGSCH